MHYTTEFRLQMSCIGSLYVFTDGARLIIELNGDLLRNITNKLTYTIERWALMGVIFEDVQRSEEIRIVG